MPSEIQSKGYTVNLSLKAEKHFNFGLDLMAILYLDPFTQCCNSVILLLQRVTGVLVILIVTANNPEVGNLVIMCLTAVQASAYYHIDYGHQKQWKTTLGVIYQAKSGSPYTYYYYGDVNEDGSRGNDLFYIPTDAQIDKMRFEETKYNNNTFTKRMFGDNHGDKLTEEMQREMLKKWIADDSYLSKHRGEYYERYADNLPFEHHFDVHFGQKYSFKVAGQINSIELTFDILNVGNLLNKDWGHTYGDGFGTYFSPVNYQGGGVYQFTGAYAYKSYSDYYSRWRGQIGLKYTF